MTIISQITVVLLICLTGMIIMYANRGLSNAAEEGEHFVDEWAIRQVKKEEKKLEKVRRRERRELASPDSDFASGSDCDSYDDLFEKLYDTPEEEGWEEEGPHREGPRSVEAEYELIQYDENHNVVNTISVDHYPFFIGREKGNDLVLHDIYIAKKHCRIMEKGGRVLVEDLGSANKIFAEGEVVNQYVLSDGCRFYLGSCEFQMKKMNHRSQATVLASNRERMTV